MRLGRIAAVAASLALCAVALALVLRVYAGRPQTDARVFYTGAVLCGPDLYNYDRQIQVQRGMVFAPYLRAPFYALALRPLLPFNFWPAWFVVNLAALALLMRLLPPATERSRNSYISLFPLLFVAGFLLNVVFQQDGAITGLILTAVLLLARVRRDWLAGAVLALTLQKPTLFLLLPLVLLLHRRWRALAGYAVTGAALAAVSVAITGWGAVRNYMDLIRRYPVELYRMPTAGGIAANLNWLPLWPLLSVLALALVLWAVRRLEFGAAFCLAIAGSLFISPQSYGHDCAVLLLPLAYFFRRGGTFLRVMELVLLFPPEQLLWLAPQPWAVLYGLGTALYVAAIAFDRRLVELWPAGPSRAARQPPHACGFPILLWWRL
jgi:hypothetical protein